jgi:hypothetical protein
MKPSDRNSLKLHAIKSIVTKFKPPKTLAEVQNMNNTKYILTYESLLTQLKNHPHGSTVVTTLNGFVLQVRVSILSSSIYL